jgi:PEGA domain
MLALQTIPKGADFYLDGQKIGQSPVNLDELIIGEHQIEIKKEGYQIIQETIQITEGQTLSKSYQLNSKKTVQIITQPKNAQVNLNGKACGKSPLTIDLPMGKNTISVSKDHYETLYTFFDVLDIKSDYSFVLEMEKHQLKIESRPKNALIYLDGDSLGKGSVTTRLAKGTYKVEVSKRACITRKTNISMGNSDKTKKLRLAPEGLLHIGYQNGEHWDGFDFGFSFNRFYFGFSYSGISNHVPDLSIALQNVSSFDVPGLPFNDPFDYFIYDVQEQESSSAGYVACVNLGYRLYRPISLIGTLGYGFDELKSIEYVYLADQDYNDASGNTVIDKGAFYSGEAVKEKFQSVVLGMILPVRLGNSLGVYFKGEYWLDPHFERSYTFGVGILYSSF